MYLKSYDSGLEMILLWTWNYLIAKLKLNIYECNVAPGYNSYCHDHDDNDDDYNGAPENNDDFPDHDDNFE